MTHTILSNTIIISEEISRGYVAHAFAEDETGQGFLCICKADEANANVRRIFVYVRPTRSAPFSTTPLDPPIEPVHKTDVLDADIPPGSKDLVVTCTTHMARESPRPTAIEQYVVQGVAHVRPVPREGPCGPLGIPYFRPGNTVTRGQVARIIVSVCEFLELNVPDIDPEEQYFEDVLVGSDFHEVTAKLFKMNAISGYACKPQP